MTNAAVKNLPLDEQSALSSKRSAFHQTLDKAGAGMSAACAIHCILMPFVIGILPVLGLGFLADHEVEIAFVSFSILLALTSLVWGFRTHGKGHLFVLLFLSALLIASGLFLVSESHHIYFVVAGALGISVSHALNLKLCKSCKECESREEEEHRCC